jgi:glycosyltransferase involved in cell wall biosynthesis
MKTSVIIPSKGGEFLEYVLKSLSSQTIKPEEVILVLKDCDTRKFEEITAQQGLRGVIIEQQGGFVTHALNLGKKEASYELILFTDDDVILPSHWVENYLKLFKQVEKTVGCVSSRDVYFDLKNKRKVKTPDDYLHVKVFRSFVRPFLDPPHPKLKKYRFGSYISKKYNFVFGKGIPNKNCYSLPFRGVNMGFRKEAIEEIKFIEHPEIRRGFRYEQHLGIQLLLLGYDSVYYPANPVLHIIRESLSRTKKIEELKKEEEIIKGEIIRLLQMER